MEKLIEDLINRLVNSKMEILNKIENHPSESDDKLTLILAGKLAAYDQCIHELHRIIKYYHECVVKI